MNGLLQRVINWNVHTLARSQCLLDNVGALSVAITQTRHMAARKGTRARKEAIAKANRQRKLAKQKQEEVKFQPYAWKKKIVEAPWMLDDDFRPTPVDNVYFEKFFRRVRHSFSAAIDMHRETHHPTVYNEPNAPVLARFHLDMTTDRNTKFVDKWSGMVAFPALFDTGSSNSVLALCNGDEEQKAALEGGAALVGGVELIKDIELGKLDKNEFDYIVAHPNVMTELIEIRGLLKRRFPTQKNGMVGVDIKTLVKRFTWGSKYQVIKAEHAPHRGWFELQIGFLNMNNEELEQNLLMIIQDINSHKVAKKTSSLTSQVLLGSPPSQEWLIIDLDSLQQEKEAVAAQQAT